MKLDIVKMIILVLLILGSFIYVASYESNLFSSGLCPGEQSDVTR